MNTVEVRYKLPAKCIKTFVDMRIWLDAQRREACRFSYECRRGEAVISLAFRDPRDAEAFATQFGGHVLEAAAPLPANAER